MDQRSDVPGPVQGGTSTKSGVSRRTVVTGVAWATPAVIVSSTLPAVAASPGRPCDAVTYSQLHATAQFLSGTLLGTRLSQVFDDPSWTGASLAQVRGLRVSTIPPAAPVADPTSAQQVTTASGTAYRMPLDVNALDAVQVTAGIPLGNLIRTDLGVLNQFAQALANGRAIGSTGAVDNSSGVIDLSNTAQSTTYASINLKNLLNEALSGGLSGVGTGLSQIADLSLNVGAVAGRAYEQDCAVCITRDYLLAWLRLVVDSPLIGAITSGLQSILNTLIGEDGVVNSLLSDLTSALSLLGIGATAQLSVTTDYTGAGDLLPDSDLVDLRLGSAQPLTIDIGALLGGAYRTDGTNSALNGLAPNTSLLINASAITNTVTELGKLAANLTGSTGAATGITATDTIRVKLVLNLSAPVLGTAAITVDDTLTRIVGGDFTPSTTGSAGIIGLLTAFLSGTLKSTLRTIGGSIRDLLASQAVTNTVNTLVTNLSTVVGTLLNALFITPGVVQLTANAQNDPEFACQPPSGAGAEPSDWSGLADGEYDVAALRLSVLGAVSDKLVTLYLARGAVGPIAHS